MQNGLRCSITGLKDIDCRSERIKMYTINRLIAIIKPKQPFFDWIESTPGWDLDLSLDDIREDCMALLIPEYGDNDKAIRYIERDCKFIFEMQLSGWYNDPAIWPEKRTLSIFRKWFDVEIHSLIYDLLEKEIMRKLG